MKPEVEKKTGKNFKEYVAVKYREQIVAGTNFLIKVMNNVIYFKYLFSSSLHSRGAET